MFARALSFCVLHDTLGIDLQTLDQEHRLRFAWFHLPYVLPQYCGMSRALWSTILANGGTKRFFVDSTRQYIGFVVKDDPYSYFLDPKVYVGTYSVLLVQMLVADATLVSHLPF